jgi:hypothetical protein
MGRQPTGSPPSVSTWEGGKIQQCTELGMHLQNMSRFDLRSLDFSLNGQGSVRLENCGAFSLSVYTESVGHHHPNDPGTPDNEWKNIHLIGCNGWKIENCTLLGSLPRGANGENYDPAYGVYVEGESKNGSIINNVFVRHRRAAIYIGPNCRNIIELNNEHQNNNDEEPGTISVIDESSEGHLVRLTSGVHEIARRVPNRVAKLQNFIIASHNFTDASWQTPPGGATPVTVVGETPGPDGVTPAQVLNFATSDPVPTSMQTISQPIPGLEGKTIILEWFHRLIELDSFPPGIGYPQLRVVIFRTGTSGLPAEAWTTEGLYRAGSPGTDWIFNRLEWQVPTIAVPNEQLRIHISNRHLNETYRLAMAGICLRVKGESACYYPKFERTGAIDRPGHGQALPGLQVLAYGGQAIRIFVAEDNPQALNLIPPFGAAQWEVGDRCLNSAPTPGGASGWVCTTAGNPGVWKAIGGIEV